MILLDPYRKIKKTAKISGAILAVVVLALVAYFYLQKKNQTENILSDQDILRQKELELQTQSKKIDNIRNNVEAIDYTPEELQKQSQKIDELRARMLK